MRNEQIRYSIRTASFAIAILFGLSSSSLAQTPTPSPTPSLEETLEFIKKKVPVRLKYSYRYFEDGPLCNVTITQNLNFNQTLLILETITTEKGSACGLASDHEKRDTINKEFRLEDVNRVSVWQSDGDSKFWNVSLLWNGYLLFDSSSGETAKRVAKAFEHAIKLAKEMDKKEPFE